MIETRVLSPCRMSLPGRSREKTVKSSRQSRRQLMLAGVACSNHVGVTNCLGTHGVAPQHEIMEPTTLDGAHVKCAVLFSFTRELNLE